MAAPEPQTHPNLEPALLLSIEEHATALARQAGALLLDSFHQDLHVEYKSSGRRDPVTNADKQAEALITSGIAQRFPDHGILSEETPVSTGLDREFVWVIDPLDGTVNYMNRYPFFSVSIGVLHRGVPVAGALFVPSPLVPQGQVIHARLNGGAFADDSPVHVYAGNEPSPNGLLTMSPSFRAYFRFGGPLRRSLGDIRVVGSIAYELALVSSGVLQSAAFNGPKVWDVAAGIIIVREAGGEVLARPRSHHWTPLRSFLDHDSGLPSDANLRNWRAWLLVGGPPVVNNMASGLRPRPFWWLWARRMARVTRRRPTTPEATGQPAAGQDKGTQDAQQGPPRAV